VFDFLHNYKIQTCCEGHFLTKLEFLKKIVVLQSWNVVQIAATLMHIDGALRHLITSIRQGLGRAIFEFCYGALEDITFNLGLRSWNGNFFLMGYNAKVGKYLLKSREIFK
jgi:hypothetical protein